MGDWRRLRPRGGGTAAAAEGWWSSGEVLQTVGRTCGVVTNRDITGGSQNSGLHAWKTESPLTEKQKNLSEGCIRDWICDILTWDAYLPFKWDVKWSASYTGWSPWNGSWLRGQTQGFSVHTYKATGLDDLQEGNRQKRERGPSM